MYLYIYTYMLCVYIHKPGLLYWNAGFLRDVIAETGEHVTIDCGSHQRQT